MTTTSRSFPLAPPPDPPVALGPLRPLPVDGTSIGLLKLHMLFPNSANQAPFTFVIPLIHTLLVRTSSVKTIKSGGEEWNNAEEG
jgi:hypothetical protein